MAFRRAKERVAFVDGFAFPVGVRRRIAASRPGLTEAQLTLVEAAARQWFRLFARHPRGARSVPSVLVTDWWREFVRHEREYAEFTAAAAGRPLPFAEVSGALAVTYRQARADEPAGLPLLFRVDGEAGVPDARRYLADCGGRGQCWPVPGATCLQHLDGAGTAPGSRGRFRPPPPPPEWTSSAGGDPGGF
ncbi:hypothetical protein [Actinoplanes sp. NPDC049265]|uniref:hypothetical protein n=1 Tax=Actinoplanes sp. NPDC049265 TaxID=3363902 RepID=UPI003712CE0F